MKPILRDWRKPCIRIIGSGLNEHNGFCVYIQVEKTKKTAVLHDVQACKSLVKAIAYPQVYRVCPQLP